MKIIKIKAIKILICFVFVFIFLFETNTDVFSVSVSVSSFDGLRHYIEQSGYDIQIDNNLEAAYGIAHNMPSDGTITGNSGNDFWTIKGHEYYFDVGGGKTVSFYGNLILNDFRRNSSSGSLYGGVFDIDGIVNFSYSNIDIIGNGVWCYSYGAYGGVAYISASGALNIDNSNIYIDGNTVWNGSGGAISLYGSFRVNNSTIIFKSNLMDSIYSGGAGFGGGALYSLGTADFLNSFVEFISNSAQSGGAIYAHNGSNTNIDGSTVNFIANSASNGSAIYAYAASNFNIRNSSVNFMKNSAQHYGAGIASPGRTNIIISGSNINFILNSSVYGAGICGYGDPYRPSAANSGICLDISASTAAFISNSAQDKGGGIYAGGSSDIDFTSATISFERNSSGFSGGAIFVRMDDNIDFNNSKVSFIKNFSRVVGAAIDIGGYDGANPTPGHFTFTNSKVDFILNSSQESDTDDGKNFYSGGGAIRNDFDSHINFINSTVNFTSNSVLKQGSGGAIHTRDKSSLNTTSSIVLFRYNSSPENGGAVYFDDAGASTISGHFINNRAGINGGAIYAKGGSSNSVSDITVSADIIDTVFENNKSARGQDIFLGGNVNLFFYASSGNAILVKGGIDSVANSNIIKIGAGYARVKGQFDISGKVTADGGKLIINVKNSNIGSLLINDDGEFSIINENTVSDRQTTVNINGGAHLKGKYSLDINFRHNTLSDYIYSIGAITVSSQNSKVSAQLWGAELKYQYLLQRNGIMIAKSETGVSGKFGGLEISTAIPTDLTVSYDNGRVFINGVNSPISTELIINYKDTEIWIEPTEMINFNDIAFTHNQKELALFLNSDAVWDGKMAPLADKIGNIAIAHKFDEVLKIFDQMHGEFYPNVIRTAAISVDADGIFARMKPQSAQDDTGNLWSELYVSGGQYGAYNNLNGDFKHYLLGAKFGKNLYADESDFWGIYARFAKSRHEQGADNADAADIEFGAYKAIFSESKLEHKFNADIGVQFYEVKRNIKIGNETFAPQSSFNTYSLKFNYESAYNNFQSKIGGIKPFAGARGALIINPEINERNGNGTELKIAFDDYIRLDILLGLQWDIDIDDWSYYAKVFIPVSVAGSRPKYKINFQDSPKAQDMSIWAAPEGLLGIGISAGTQYNLNDDLNAYFNLSADIDDNHFGYYAGIGIIMKFGRKIIEEKAAETPEIEDAQKRRKNALQSYKMSAALFRADSAVLSNAAKSNIKKIVEQIKKIKFKMITIEGHTDSKGGDDYNIVLSRNRAKAVYDEFIKNGISQRNLAYIGFGEKLPAKSNKTAAGRQANRRVEIFVE
ncbi:MAG: OmpA family protein [Elusimicrobiota bacterium]|jgi:predicted outer membrane repeat protein|nr:OmpA family protein [Elusimicrobiota bacterium]